MTHPKILLTTKRFRVETASHQTDDGQVHRREVVRHPGAVTILPMVDLQHVCLIKNYRVAVARTLIELPAGTLEPNEEPAATAERELIEETGYRAGEMEHLHSFFLSPGILDERMHLYVATELTPGQAAREPGEEIENLVVPWDQAIRMVVDGQIEDAKTICGLLFYAQRMSGR